MAVKERSILFSADMVRAIIENRKTMTRRVAKPQPHPDFLARGVMGIVPQWPLQDGVRWFMADGMSELVKCPYGKPGDVLYVKEGLKRFEDGTVAYAIDGRPALADGEVMHWPWKLKTLPSIFMPKRYARRWIRLTSVRVERLNEISEADAMAEGIRVGHYYCDEAALENDDHGDHDDIGTHRCKSAIEDFRILWESLHGPGSFDSRWVWVLGFERHERG